MSDDNYCKKPQGCSENIYSKKKLKLHWILYVNLLCMWMDQVFTVEVFMSIHLVECTIEKQSSKTI